MFVQCFCLYMGGVGRVKNINSTLCGVGVGYYHVADKFVCYFSKTKNYFVYV